MADFDPANSLQLIAQNIRLTFNCISYAYADNDIRRIDRNAGNAARFFLTRLANFNNFPAREAALFFGQANAHALIRQSKWDKDCARVRKPSQRLAAIRQGCERDFVNLILSLKSMRNPQNINAFYELRISI